MWIALFVVQIFNRRKWTFPFITIRANRMLSRKVRKVCRKRQLKYTYNNDNQYSILRSYYYGGSKYGDNESKNQC